MTFTATTMRFKVNLMTLKITILPLKRKKMRVLTTKGLTSKVDIMRLKIIKRFNLNTVKLKFYKL